jgi:hypothetical protein
MVNSEGILMKRTLPLLLLLGISGIGWSACSDPQEPCFCTEEFRTYLVTVLEPDGRPADGLRFSVTRTADGRDATPDQGFLLDEGVYVVLSDAQLDLVDEAGTSFRVTASRDGASVTADFVFDTDTCRCHVQRVSGPETIQLVADP